MEIKNELCQWFRENHRKLPFRENKDPYSIWVSEIMAQQTRIDTMIPYYEKWMQDYPTIEALANAPLEKVLKSWEGLGYYNRARKLHEGAKQVMREYYGKLPENADELEKIQGIGPYTAGAIASIAFEKEAPAVDGNVLRVVSRLLQFDEDITKLKTQRHVKEIVLEWMKGSQPSDFTQGLMELGALICMPGVVLCNQCPLNQKCQSYAHQTQMNFPKKPKKKEVPVLQYKTLLIRQNHQILLSKDDRDGLMKGFYRLPQFENLDTKGYHFKKNYKHVYSHKIWKMEVYEWQSGKIPDDDYLEWVDERKIDEIVMIGAHRKILDEWSF